MNHCYGSPITADCQASNYRRYTPWRNVCSQQLPSNRIYHLMTCIRRCHHESSHQSRWQRVGRFPLIRYLRSLKWTPIPLSLGFTLIAYQQFRHVRRRESQKSGPLLASDFEITCYRMLPLKTMSRLWGWVNNLELPVWARKPVIEWYIRSFGCDLSEAAEEDVKQYRNLGEFFRRSIKAHVRPVDHSDCVVSPSDGKVMHFGLVTNNHMEQVKGVSYSLQTFLGPNTWDCHSTNTPVPNDVYQTSLLHNKANNLYHCIIYLAPGDYHCFHSPVDWELRFRRHFSGELFSVNPGIASWIAGLFNLNERAVYVGQWKYGFFSMTAVGATNVGSIKVKCDKDLTTNVKGWKKGTHHDYSLVQQSSSKCIEIKKGDFFGEFNLGSTIVLVFEAPPHFQFNLESGKKIKFGQSLNNCMQSGID